MFSVRENVFESNSSSCHSVTIVSKSVFMDFKNGKYVFVLARDELIPLEDIYKLVRDATVKADYWERRTEFLEVTRKDFYKVFIDLLDNGKLTSDYYYQNRKQFSDIEQLVADAVAECFEGSLYSYKTLADAEEFDDFEIFQRNVDGTDVTVLSYTYLN